MYQYFDCVPYHKLIQDIKHLHFKKFLMCYWCKQWRLFNLLILLDFMSPITCLNVSKMRATIYFFIFHRPFKISAILGHLAQNQILQHRVSNTPTSNDTKSNSCNSIVGMGVNKGFSKQKNRNRLCLVETFGSSRESDMLKIYWF